MDRQSSVLWTGSGKDGRGRISSQSGALKDASFTYFSRYENGEGTNPEELIAAAHAACFTMKLSFILKEERFSSEKIETNSTVTLEKNGIVQSFLRVRAQVPGISKELFEKCANNAKENCPVSKALNINIKMDAGLEEAVEVEI